MNDRFPAGSVIIRREEQFPNGALIVDGYDASGSLLAHPLGGGFQFIIATQRLDTLRLVTDAEQQANLYRHAHFALDGVEGVFAGWTDGRHWNGWLHD